ncbi:hypothetical protein ACIBCM_24190 [Streptomyces sp. NPDC051018]|uniref:hypothetical protein n=1 Tax=Streptomyces sp. NPDC051018 TaxID=3365639 RepID=UPI0037B4E153
MSASKRIRAAGAWWHLLFVVLALGVFAMHTVGHPDSGSGTAHPGSPSGTAAVTGAHTPVTAVRAEADRHGDDGTRTAGAMAASPVSEPSPGNRTAAGHQAAGHDTAGSPASGMSMNMVSLCVAVLGTWLLAGLIRAALSRRTEWLALFRAGAVVALRPEPPPPRPDLVRLSILRI